MPDSWRRFGGASFFLFDQSSRSGAMPRLYLTAREYDALLKRQRGTCCVRGCKASTGPITVAPPKA